jgi:hypothetical protein
MRQKWSQLYEFQAITYIKEENPGPIPPNNKDLRRPQCTEVEPQKNDLLYVQSGTPDDGWKDHLKHVVLLQNKNKFEKLVHLVGITTETNSSTEGRTFVATQPDTCQ